MAVHYSERPSSLSTLEVLFPGLLISRALGDCDSPKSIRDGKSTAVERGLETQKQEKRHCILNFHDSKHWFSYHLVMQAHRFGPQHGIPLSAIHQPSPTDVTGWDDSRVHWKKDFSAVIVGECLLVRDRMFRIVKSGEWNSKSEYWIKDWNLLEGCCHNYSRYGCNEDVCWISIRALLNELDMKVAEKNNKGHGATNGRITCCRLCPTEWEMRLIPRSEYTAQAHTGVLPPSKRRDWFRRDYMVVSTRYIDLGECCDPNDGQWARVIGMGPISPSPNTGSVIRARFLTVLKEMDSQAK